LLEGFQVEDVDATTFVHQDLGGAEDVKLYVDDQWKSPGVIELPGMVRLGLGNVLI
jgi:hypothetical protein